MGPVAVGTKNDEDGMSDESAQQIQSSGSAAQASQTMTKRHLWHRLIYRLLRIFRVRCSREEVDNRAYADSGDSELKLPHPIDEMALDLVLDEARASYEQQQRRLATIDEKVRTLLSLTSVMLPLAIAFLSSAPPYAIIVPILFLLSTSVLLSDCLGVTKFNLVNTPECRTESNVEDLKRSLVGSYYLCSVKNHLVVDYRVDVFRAALRSFLVALLTIGAIAIASPFFQSQDMAMEARIAKMLQDDARFRESLVGKQGPPGQQGVQGPIGPPGSPCFPDNPLKKN